MAEEKDIQRDYGKIVARAWEDEDFKKELLSNPSAVFKANGIDIPEGIEVKVVEDTATTVHFTLPPKPAEGELSEEDLDGVAAGAFPCICGCGVEEQGRLIRSYKCKA